MKYVDRSEVRINIFHDTWLHGNQPSHSVELGRFDILLEMASAAKVTHVNINMTETFVALVPITLEMSRPFSSGCGTQFMRTAYQHPYSTSYIKSCSKLNVGCVACCSSIRRVDGNLKWRVVGGTQ